MRASEQEVADSLADVAYPRPEVVRVQMPRDGYCASRHQGETMLTPPASLLVMTIRVASASDVSPPVE